MIVIIDYQMGNIGSILNMLKKIGEKIEFSTPQRDAQIAIAAMSLLLKYTISTTLKLVLLERKTVLLEFKYY